MKLLGIISSSYDRVEVIRARFVDVNGVLQPLAPPEPDVISVACVWGSEDVNGRVAIDATFVSRR